MSRLKRFFVAFWQPFFSEISERSRARTRRDDRAVVSERVESMMSTNLSRARSPSVALARRWIKSSGHLFRNLQNSTMTMTTAVVIVAIIVAVAAFAVDSVDALAPIQSYRVDAVTRWRRAARDGARLKTVDDDDAYTRWFTQRLDHFAPWDARTWQQRYFVNAAFVDALVTTVPEVFVCVGGEGPALTSRAVIDGDVHCAIAVSLAKKRRAYVVALEHRFYGASQPTGDLSTDSLKFLSSAQALEDLAAFSRGELQRAFGVQDDTKIVVFGGSYPGMVAGWFRVKYPHIAYAAVASSAPVRAELDMRGYYDVVGAALRERDIGGSDACYDSVQEAFSFISQALTTSNGRRELELKFNVCPLKNGEKPLDAFGGRDAFAMTIQTLFPAQSNDPSCTLNDDTCMNIAKACSTMEAMDGALDGVALLATMVFGDECLDIDGAESMRALKNEKPDLTGEGERQWTWQTCTEFAFFQTCEKESKCPFKLDPPANALESYEWLCRELFDVNVDQIAESVNRTNTRYGADAPGGTRIIYPSGSVDPWVANSVTRSRWLEPAFVVRGASHHAWTHPPKSSDTPAVVDARATIESTITTWLDRGPNARAIAR